MVPELSISLQARDGSYVKLGTGHRRGVIPESISISGDVGEYGCSEASWLMHMDPKYHHDLLEHYTPCVIEDGAVSVWSGRVIATPTTYGDDQVVHVSSQGWGQHTKDDCIDKLWVVRDLSQWQEGKTQSAANPAGFSLGCGVDANGTAVILNAPTNAKVYQNRLVACAVLDMGPNNVAKRIVCTHTGFGAWGASASLIARSGEVPDMNNPGSYTDAFNNAAVVAASTVDSGNFATGYRYVMLGLYYTGADVTLTVDQWLKFTDIQVYTATALDSGTGVSAVFASTVIADTLTACCPLISSDQAGISATTTGIPHFPAGRARRYANELIDQANAHNGRQFLLTADPVPKPIYRDVPSTPTWVVGARDEYKFENPSQNDGRSVYSRVISEYADASGIPAEASTSAQMVASQIQLTNAAGFEVDTSSWNVATGTLVRDTGVFDTGVASGRLTSNGVNGQVGIGNISPIGTTKPGRSYKMVMRIRREVTLTSALFSIKSDNGASGVFFTAGGVVLDLAATLNALAVSTWSTVEIPFVTSAGNSLVMANGATDNGIALTGGPAGVATILAYIDKIEIQDEVGTVISRRGFVRTALKPFTAPTSAATAAAIAALELAAAQFPPLKGALAVTGRIRRIGGDSVSVNRLPMSVGDMLLIENLTDPNTGAVGRAGIIMRATYDQATDTTTVEIDDPSDFIDVIRTRIAG